MEWTLITQTLFIFLWKFANNIIYFHLYVIFFFYKLYRMGKRKKRVALATPRAAEFAHVRQYRGSIFHIMFIVFVVA